MSWELWDAGLIPRLAQWGKDLALPALQLRWQVWLRSDPWPSNSMCFSLAKNGKQSPL